MSRSGCFVYLLLIVGGLAAGALWLHQSVYWSLISVEKAAQSGDVVLFERHVDLGLAADGAAVFAEVMAEEGLRGATGSDVAGKLAGAFARGLAGAVAEVNKADARRVLRQKIVNREAFTRWGPFVPDPEQPLSPRERLGDTWLVELRGTCGGVKTHVDLVFTRVPGPLEQGWLGHWRATELRRESAVKMVRDCMGKPAVDEAAEEERANP